MNLPSSGITWNQYRNTTPTFDLTPVEKPDFSPFLIHMTGRNSLVSILKGEGAKEGIEIPKTHGYIRATMPCFDSHISYYNSEVVCFSESPLFAIDFFRYRSYRRWKDDQQFGIGFSKSYLAKYSNVRPVIYLDDKTNKQILHLCNQIINESYSIIDTSGNVIDAKEIFQKIKPLLFPLLETTYHQGFMWEREWRCPDPNGLIFPFDAIKIICCPNNERKDIEEILGEHLQQIKIVETWKEYDDVTTYLKRRETETKLVDLSKIKLIADLTFLEELKLQNEQTINTLKAYYGVFKDAVNIMEEGNINGTIADMEAKSKQISNQIKLLQDKRKAEAEASKKSNL